MTPPVTPPIAAPAAIEPPPVATADPIRAPTPAPTPIPIRVFRCWSGIEPQPDKRAAAQTAIIAPRMSVPRRRNGGILQRVAVRAEDANKGWGYSFLVTRFLRISSIGSAPRDRD